MVAVLHDLSIAAKYCDRIYALCDGRVVRYGTPSEVIDRELIAQLYHIDCEVFTRHGVLYLDYA